MNNNHFEVKITVLGLFTTVFNFSSMRKLILSFTKQLAYLFDDFLWVLTISKLCQFDFSINAYIFVPESIISRNNIVFALYRLLHERWEPHTCIRHSSPGQSWPASTRAAPLPFRRWSEPQGQAICRTHTPRLERWPYYGSLTGEQRARSGLGVSNMALL